MFIETHVGSDAKSNDIVLTFLNSLNVQAYPCGRRRSTDIENDTGDKEKYRIPFDPEARLNTEANNRKHSSLNGFTQTYLKDWDENTLTISLAGYLFTITLDSGYASENAFGTALFNALTTDNKELPEATHLYANILIEDVHLFSGFTEYYTGILRNQSGDVSEKPETALDLVADETAAADIGNFYFSGLSFSATPLTGSTEFKTYDSATNTKNNQTAVSLCLLETTALDENGKPIWKIHEPARLPKIMHGDTEDSVVVAGNTLMQSDLTVEGKATVKEAEIAEKTTVTGELVVKNDDPTKATLDNALITGVLVVTNPASNPDNPNYDPETSPASIVADNAGITALSAGTVEAEDIRQKLEDGEYYKVPVISIQQKSDGFYQLQISRINYKN